MCHEILEGPERRSPGNEEATFVQLSNPVVLDRVAIANCSKSKVILVLSKYIKVLFKLGSSGNFSVCLNFFTSQIETT